MKRLYLVLAAGFLAACTPGGLPASGGGSSAAVTIDVNLTNHPAGNTPAGLGGGFAPLVTTVAVGTTIKFTNSDGFTHTSTSVPGNPASFPIKFPFSSSALSQSGSTLSGGWSSGDMLAGTSSQTVTADLPGSYIYGCFHHYGAPMRGVIVVH